MPREHREASGLWRPRICMNLSSSAVVCFKMNRRASTVQCNPPDAVQDARSACDRLTACAHQSKYSCTRSTIESIATQLRLAEPRSTQSTAHVLANAHHSNWRLRPQPEARRGVSARLLIFSKWQTWSTSHYFLWLLQGSDTLCRLVRVQAGKLLTISLVGLSSLGPQLVSDDAVPLRCTATVSSQF